MGLVCDDNQEPVVVYHGTRTQFDQIDTRHTVDRGLHFGSQEQARMRCGGAGRLVAAHIQINSVRRCRDEGGNWKQRIEQARSAGHDGIVYLNRYEGVPLERIEQAISEGVDLDRLTDAQFRKRIPEAQDSWIVFSTSQVRLLPEQDIGPRKDGQKPRP